MAEPKLVWNPDNVRDVAESVGIATLNDEAVRTLAQDVEYRLSQVLGDAIRNMHASKRTVLGTQDVAQALKMLDVEPLYGYESTRPLRFGEASLGPGQPLFYIEDEEVDFEKLINAPLPKVPRDMSFTAHWLAVDGVQPAIPQNPTTAEARASELVPKGPGANPALAALAGNDNLANKPAVKHILSKELILFFDKIRDALLDADNDPEVLLLHKTALESVANDPGLHQLIPYFITFIAEKVTHSLNNIFVLKQMMELASALIRNPTMFLDPYITYLVPAILTCLIGRHLGSAASSATSSGMSPQDLAREQFDLRDVAASLLSALAAKYSASVRELRARTLRTCLECWLTPTKTLPEHYGALCGIMACGGADAVRKTVLPNLKLYETVLIKAEERIRDDVGDADALKMVQAACIRAVLMLKTGDATSATSMDPMIDAAGDSAMQMDTTPDGEVGEETSTQEAQIIDFLGKVIGGRIVKLKDVTLNRDILNARDL